LLLQLTLNFTEVRKNFKENYQKKELNEFIIVFKAGKS